MYFKKLVNIWLIITMSFSFSLLATDKTIDPHSLIRFGLNGLVSHSFLIFHPMDRTEAGGATAAGFIASFLYPLPRFLPLGLEIATEFVTSGSFIYFDIDPFLKIPLNLAHSGPLMNVYVTTPVGFSLARFLSSGIVPKSTPMGFNVGASLGKEFFFAERFGWSFELAYRYRYLAGNEADKRFSIHFNEFGAMIGLNVGI